MYKVGTLKKIPNQKNYVFIDGGMADNPRPSMYQSKYTIKLANKAELKEEECYSIAGKFCESGDILAESVQLPKVMINDLLIVFGTGAYNYSMSSNYNRFCKPAMVALDQQGEEVWVKRETYDDLLQHDM